MSQPEFLIRPTTRDRKPLLAQPSDNSAHFLRDGIEQPQSIPVVTKVPLRRSDDIPSVRSPSLQIGGLQSPAMNPNEIHRISRGEIEHILRCLRFIDRAREALHARGAGNEAIIDELHKSANGIYQVARQLPRID